MRHPGNFMRVLNMLHNIKGFITASTAGPVGTGHKVRFKFREIANCFKKILIAFFSFGWKELEGKGGFFCRKEIFNLLHMVLGFLKAFAIPRFI